ncbi:guanine nucleotide binding protein, alpha subunit [Panaeolus papilionaceus]|nr:guanine nucleotide binding protein, alpha subunit [Panaeolus papilionaceus]
MPISVPKRNTSTSLWPPSLVGHKESDEERKARLRLEADARRVSEKIDQQLEEEDKQRKKKGVEAKILLLGQAESGKSTVLKNFQLYFAPKAFEVEAEMWRPIIHLNLVRSVNFVVNFISNRSGSNDPNGVPTIRDRASSSSLTSATTASATIPSIPPELRKLCIRLAPLRQVEENLIRFLSNGTGMALPHVSYNPVTGEQMSEKLKSMLAYHPLKASEVSIPSGSSWRRGLKRRSEDALTDESNASTGSYTLAERSDDGQNRRILAALGDDMAVLWTNSAVQQSLKSAEIALEEQPGFFLDQALRITREDYVPQPDDVLRARVTTIGPEEHKIVAEHGTAKHWTIYDVGGSRAQRATWAQFFDDVNVIIFLAPMSGFNQVLAEDESVNRLTDSLRLWQTICSNKLLAGIEFVLFLNKLDILDAKLKSGIQFSSYVTSYLDKPNETKPVAKYLLDVFVSLHQQHSPQRRRLHPHLTCAVDTKATASVIHRIQELILVKLLAQTNIL